MKRKWSVSGNLMLSPEFQELSKAYGSKIPLEGIKIELLAKEKILGIWGTWNSWGTKTADAEGRFFFEKTLSDNSRRFKVRMQFKNSHLVVYGRNDGAMKLAFQALLGTKVLPVGRALLEVALSHMTRVGLEAEWFEVFEDSDKGGRGPGDNDLGNLIFKDGGRMDLGDKIARRHAEVWVLYNKVIKLMASYGGDYKFTKKVAIKYPHNNLLIDDNMEECYANPANEVVYIIKNDQKDRFNLGTLLHELMHVWAYQHSTGELGMAIELFKNRDTHREQEKSFVAFHEGFASYSNYHIQEALFGEHKDRLRPYSRKYLIESFGLENRTELNQNDYGWISILNTLSLPEIHKYNFTDGSPYVTPWSSLSGVYRSPDIHFKNVLSVFLSHPNRGYKKPLSTDEMNYRDFFTRASACIKDFPEEMCQLYLKLIDPQSTVQPKDHLATLIAGKPRFDVITNPRMARFERAGRAGPRSQTMAMRRKNGSRRNTA